MEIKGVRRFGATKREGLFSSVGAERTMRHRERERDDRTAGDRDRGGQGGGSEEREREGPRESSRTRFGASPIILQSSATTHRHFLPPQQKRR